jgi:hypothetical protein
MTIELCGANLKLKYRSHKPKGTNHANFSGNQGHSIKGTPPVGLRKRPKGRSVMARNLWGRPT